MEGGGGVIAGFHRFISDHTVCVFEEGRVISKGNQGGEHVKEDGGVACIYLLP